MSEETASIPVDAHVHLHRIDCVSNALEAAARNFTRLENVDPSGVRGVLLLTQSRDEQVFEKLAVSSAIGRWAIRHSNDEPHSLLASDGQHVVAVICGRQVRTIEGLEVQCLGTLREFPDGMSLAEALEAMHDSVGLTVIPWGLGKWTGRRLEVLKSMLNWVEPSAVFLGDNGGRLGLIDPPPLLAGAERRGFRILPGSDPFPILGDVTRIGSFGFRAEIGLSERDPWRVLRDWLRSRPSSPLPYGRPMALGRFLLNQGGIRVYQRYLRLRGSD